MDDVNVLSLDLNSAPVIHSSGDSPVCPISPNVEFEADLVDHGSKPPVKSDQSGLLIDQLNRMKSENKKLLEMLFLVYENYIALQNNMTDLMQNSCRSSEDMFLPRKRKHESSEFNSVITLGNDASSETNIYGADESPRTPYKAIRTNISRVFVRTKPTDTSLVVKDGYHWRKYGQKVTKDNPSPRAYFKCSFSPNCHVKKKVQRSLGDPSILVATYEGEHNHPSPLQAEMLAATSQGAATAFCPSASCMDFPGLGKPTAHDSIDPRPGIFNKNTMEKCMPDVETDAVQKLMVEQMATSLTRNPSFTAALVAAISGRILSHDDDDDQADK